MMSLGLDLDEDRFRAVIKILSKPVKLNMLDRYQKYLSILQAPRTKFYHGGSVKNHGK